MVRELHESHNDPSLMMQPFGFEQPHYALSLAATAAMDHPSSELKLWTGQADRKQALVLESKHRESEH